MALNRQARRQEKRREKRLGEARPAAAGGDARQRLAMLRQQAGMHYQQGRLAPALSALKEMLAIVPDDAATLGLAALCALRLGSHDEALALLGAQRRALDAGAANAQAYRGLAGLLGELGAHDEAEAALAHAVGRWPDDGGLALHHGELLKNAGRLEAAAEAAGRATQLAPGDSDAWLLLGVTRQKQGLRGEAIDAYRKALEIAPRERTAIHNMGAALLGEGRADEALSLCEAWLAWSPADIEALAMKGHALQELGRTQEAAYLFDFDHYVQGRTVRVPEGYDSLEAFNAALEAHVLKHPALHVPDEDDARFHHPSLSLAFELLEGDTGPVGALETLMREAVDDYLATMPDDAEHPFVRCKPGGYRLYAWAAVLNGEGNMDSHVHKDGYLSGCYYLSIPDEIAAPGNGADGDIKGGFEVGRPPREFGCRATHMTRQFKPHEGFMLLFPAYLYHCTIPFKADRRRICIAFDVMPA